MTDRHAGYIVTLEDDVREDDAESILTALRMVRGVINVQPIIADSMLAIARSRAEHELKNRIWEAFNN